MTKREWLRAAQRDFSGVRNMQANLIENLGLQAYAEIHSEVCIPSTLNADGETYTWQGGTAESPASSLTRWCGRPAVIIASSEEWVKLRPEEIARRRARFSDGNENVAYAVNYRGATALAYAIGRGNVIMLVEALASGTDLTIYHYATPTPLTSPSAEVEMPSGFEDVLTKKTVWLVTIHLMNLGIPGFGVTRARQAQENYLERMLEMKAFLHSDENIEYIRDGGQDRRLLRSVIAEIERAF